MRENNPCVSQSEGEVGNRTLRAGAFVEDNKRVIDGARFLRPTQTHDGVDEKEALGRVLRVLFFALIFPVLEQCANLVAERGLISQSRSSREYQKPGDE